MEVPEQEGMLNILSVSIGFYKNPPTHRNVETEVVDTAQVIVFAKNLLQMVDRFSPPFDSP